MGRRRAVYLFVQMCVYILYVVDVVCVIFLAVTTCFSTVFQCPRQIDLPECLWY